MPSPTLPLSVRFARAYYSDDPYARLKALGQEWTQLEKREINEALVECARRGQIEAVRLLLPHADPTFEAGHALHVAVMAGHTQVVSLLLEFMGNLSGLRNVLYSSLEKGHYDIAHLLAPYTDLSQRVSSLSFCLNKYAQADISSQLRVLVGEMTLDESISRIDEYEHLGKWLVKLIPIDELANLVSESRLGAAPVLTVLDLWLSQLVQAGELAASAMSGFPFDYLPQTQSQVLHCLLDQQVPGSTEHTLPTRL